MSEEAPQPQDIFTEAQSYDNFDSWLTNIPDERLQEAVNVLAQVDAGKITDEEKLSQLLGVAMHFRGNQPMSTEEVERAFQVLAHQIGFEAHVRNGVVTKDGEYSMQPDGSTRFTVTDKGREIFGKGGDV